VQIETRDELIWSEHVEADDGRTAMLIVCEKNDVSYDDVVKSIAIPISQRVGQ
jgi:hypothetical protein